jgi:hypothetical protein
METKILIYRPDIESPELRTIDLPAKPSYTQIYDAFQPILGFNCQDVEHVNVLYENKHADMFVDGNGATTLHGRKPLEYNQQATNIYYAASEARGEKRTATSAMIHGIAIICLRRIWF